MQAIFTALRALIYAAGFFFVWGWIAVQLRPIDGRLDFSPPVSLVPLGLILVLLGVLVTASCIFVFVRFGRGTPAPFDPPRKFVAVGPYRFVRNPMYIGGLLIIFGAGLAIRSVSITALAVLFFGVMHLFVTLYEEASLERRFGSSYAAYRERVRRWLPRRSPSVEP